MKLSLLLFFLNVIVLYGQSNNQLESVDKFILAEHNEGRFNGAITIGNGDSIVYENFIGIANRTWGQAIQKETRFDIASINKSFIAALVLLAVEEGYFTLETKLSDLIQKFHPPSKFDCRITIHQLLTHTSGLGDYSEIDSSLKVNNFRRFKRLNFTNDEYINFISEIELVGAPNNQFYYSNFAYHLLCILLEDVYEQDFNTILQSKICLPLGLESTVNVTDNKIIVDSLAFGYELNNGEWLSNDFIDLRLGRRIFSTSEDLYKWGYWVSTNKLLSKNSRTLMFANHIESINNAISYGYGWVTFEKGEKFRMGDLGIEKPYFVHGGSTGGYRSILVNVNNSEYIISILGNIGDEMSEIELTKGILKRLLKDEK